MGKRAGAWDDAHSVVAEAEEIEREEHEAAVVAHMGHIDMDQQRCDCDTGEPVAAAAGSNSRGTGSYSHRVLGRPAGTAGFGYTVVFFGPSPAASLAGLPADDDRSSCRRGSLLQTNRVLGQFGSCESQRCTMDLGVDCR